MISIKIHISFYLKMPLNFCLSQNDTKPLNKLDFQNFLFIIFLWYSKLRGYCALQNQYFTYCINSKQQKSRNATTKRF